ncbi:DUF2171 domain-containing protein [Deinococcus sp. Leaf326]|uniref:DUF2171 domain-containing protein n=1 Tax=Deinococcus sp. Leaf326 TaxID=1736338 RepID=UPI0006F6907B|nr:DUF2171 domain-containing protein [Deinococcus sp. Leaf326]KQR01084.1 hypothetical protein ASF71_13100 [Deinococcus sp. Leaf326]
MNEVVSGLPIICADDLIHGYAEGIERDYLLTTPFGDGHRHFIPIEVIEQVGDAVYLKVTPEELLRLF